MAGFGPSSATHRSATRAAALLGRLVGAGLLEREEVRPWLADGRGPGECVRLMHALDDAAAAMRRRRERAGLAVEAAVRAEILRLAPGAAIRRAALDAAESWDGVLRPGEAAWIAAKLLEKRLRRG